MAFDFPTGVAVDYVYTSVDGIQFTWNGQAWVRNSTGSGSGPTPPPVGTPGQAWVVNPASQPEWGAPIEGGNY
jgi:hypothetical protein